MKVIFDCTALTKWIGKPTGIQRVISELGISLARAMPETFTVIFDSDGKCYSYSPESKEIGNEIKIDKGDLIFASGHDWDYPEHFKHLCHYAENDVKLAVLFYDIIPLKFPFTYSSEFVARFEFWLNRALSLASLCFTISASTRSDLLEYAKKSNLRIPNIDILRIGDNLPVVKNQVSEQISENIKGSYILSVGTIEYRKNHIILLNAYRYMIDVLGMDVPKLYIAGRQGLYDANVHIQVEGDPLLKGKVEILSGLDDSDLGALYGSAMFTVYPSIYEGWGLPVAESLCYGVPCITSKSSSMLEIAPELTPFANPLMTNEWVDIMRLWIEKPDELAKVRKQVNAQYHKTSWDDTASLLRDSLMKFSHILIN
ncbi:TPA: glycosyltransferase family 4 protein [Enterobacter kobei]|uniref:glycosyltransferase family 4 protein n=1 Tax=Enterobacter asburiae TaxID=61645 RepID=UPI001432D3D7|nr:glycosyltransferase family 1 protein [Enterobacter asburiae]NKD22851.1 glycosyltransferase family 4 protein [Enterobacter asburiae]